MNTRERLEPQFAHHSAGKILFLPQSNHICQAVQALKKDSGCFYLPAPLAADNKYTK